MGQQIQTRTDVIQEILGYGDDSNVASLRNAKPNQVDELQAYFRAIFEPNEESAAAFPTVTRHLVAIRVASHTGSTSVVDWYSARARDARAADDTIAQVRDVTTSTFGDSFLDAAIRHTDLLTKRPSEAQASDLDALKGAGFSPQAVLALSQTIAFVSYQLRLIAGLRAFGEQS